MGLTGKNKGHINTATGRNKREMGGILKGSRNYAETGWRGGIRRRNGRPAESRAAWRRRIKTGRQGG